MKRLRPRDKVGVSWGRLVMPRGLRLAGWRSKKSRKGMSTTGVASSSMKIWMWPMSAKAAQTRQITPGPVASTTTA